MSNDSNAAHWSQALAGFGLLGVLFGVAAPIPGHRQAVLLVAIGVLAVGVGEWIAHPLFERVYRSDGMPTRWVGLRKSRRTSPMVWFADLLGAGLILLGLISLFVEH
jgi:hypothetical protein